MRSFFNYKSNLIILLILVVIVAVVACEQKPVATVTAANTVSDSLFIPPDTGTIPNDEFGNMVRYGRELIMNTAYYLGPDGVVGHYLGNKMNCGNCHVDGGTRPFGLNYFSSHARYPQYRGREDRILSLAERVNNCIERPHNGRPIPLDSKEMIAIVSYMRWLGKDVPVGEHVPGDGAAELEYPDRAADPLQGELVYNKHCARCHGANGEGQMRFDSVTYTYPPLWGKYSYEASSSMHRVLKAARFIKANMPQGLATWQKPLLTDIEAIDVAAFINSEKHDRPKRNFGSESYPNPEKKPIDYDEGPYVDSFSAQQHKYGPFQPMIDYHKQHDLPVVF